MKTIREKEERVLSIEQFDFTDSQDVIFLVEFQQRRTWRVTILEGIKACHLSEDKASHSQPV